MPRASTPAPSRRSDMGVRDRDVSDRGEIGKVAVIGAGTIGASWAAGFLFHGLDVVASDPAPEGEAFLRCFIAEAWPALARLGTAAPGASPERLRFVRDPAE